jgi:L-alanine-DL-glutamate epimerase-like enolase superfamily enzyme
VTLPLIERIEVRHYRLPLDPPFRASWDPEPRTWFASTVVRVEAGGVEGVGSGDSMPGFAGHEHLFIGRDPTDIERHVAVLDNLQFHYGRMWPLEIALWDLTGKLRGEPLWRMLGGASGRLRVYASTGERVSAEERAASAVGLRDAGFQALKLRFHAADPAEDIAVVSAVRDAAGDGMGIMVDANQGWRMPWDTSPTWDLETAMRVAHDLAALGVYWLEEPLDRHDYVGLAAVRRDGGVRVAGGEGNREFADFEQYLAHGSLDVFQPDVAWSTGVLRATQLAARVRAAGAMYTPHTWGDGLVLLANLHVAAACANAPFVEFPYDPPGWTPERRDFILPSPLLPDAEGYVTLPDAPGLGVSIDWDRVGRYRVEEARISPGRS